MVVKKNDKRKELSKKNQRQSFGDEENYIDHKDSLLRTIDGEIKRLKKLYKLIKEDKWI